MSSKRWVFTINNPIETDYFALSRLTELDLIDYVVYGKETGDSGTPHLQGFVIWKDRKTRNSSCHLLGGRAHVEPTRGTNKQASDYCKKDGDFTEEGTLPQQGKRSDIELCKEWIEGLGRRPTDREWLDHFPSLWFRNRGSCIRMADVLQPEDPVPPAVLRDWQQDLIEQLDATDEDRKIYFVVDEVGNTGKTWLARRMLLTNSDVQYLRIGKRDDIAHAIDENKSIFLFDIDRSSMEFLQYSILEQLKDGLVFSPKYDSRVKRIKRNSKVVVFCNEYPDPNKLSADRYILITPGDN